MKTIGAGFLALVAATVVPAAIIVTYYAYGTLTVPGVTEDPYAWIRVRNFSLMAFAISLGHVVVLGIPTFLILYWRKAITWWSSVIVGFVLGCLPVGVWSWPLRYPELKSSASHWNGEKMVDTVVNGVPTMAGWISYTAGVAFMGLFGALGGLAFWLTWRSMRPKSRCTRFSGAALRTVRRPGE